MMADLGLHELYPPSNIHAEKSFLGSLLTNNKVLEQVPWLKPDHFVDPVNARIFEECAKLIEASRVADAVTLKTVLHSDVLAEVGGVPYLTELLASMVGIINARDYAKVVKETWERRRLIQIADALRGSAYGTSDTDIAMQALAEIDEIVAGRQAGQAAVSLNVAIDAAMDAIDKAGKSGGPPGIRSGFDCVDARIGGFEPGLIYTLAGDTGSGKSSLGLQWMLTAAKAKVPVQLFSLEMTVEQLGRRALAVESGVPNFVMRRGNMSYTDEKKVMDARKRLRDMPLSIDDMAGQTMSQIRSKVRATRRKFGGLGMIGLDHLNLVRGEGTNPTHSTSLAADMCLELAKEEKAAFLQLCQLSRRGGDSDGDHRPTLDRLRQSGTIEQNASVVFFVYREEMWLGGTPERKTTETAEAHANRMTAHIDRCEKAKNKAELICAKIRDPAGEGGPGTDVLRWDGPTTRFIERSMGEE